MIRRALALSAILFAFGVIFASRAGALPQEGFVISPENPKVIKSYPPMAGQYALPAYAYVAFGPESCRSSAYCDDIPIQLIESTAHGVVATGLLITLDWQSTRVDVDPPCPEEAPRCVAKQTATNNQMYLWFYDEGGGAISQELPNEGSQRVRVLDLEGGMYSAEPINDSGVNLGYTLTAEMILQVLPDAPYLRPSDKGFNQALQGAGSAAGPGSVSFLPSDNAAELDPSGKGLVPDKIAKVPGADGAFGDQPLDVVAKGQQTTTRETVVSPVAFGLGVVGLSAIGAFAYARIRKRRESV